MKLEQVQKIRFRFLPCAKRGRAHWRVGLERDSKRFEIMVLLVSVVSYKNPTRCAFGGLCGQEIVVGNRDLGLSQIAGSL
jgi:hypothetical protein